MRKILWHLFGISHVTCHANFTTVSCFAYWTTSADPGTPSAATSCGAPGDAAGDAKIEMREGCHLPPQMPLLKRRLWLPLEEAEAQRLRLQEEGGYRRSEPLF